MPVVLHMASGGKEIRRKKMVVASLFFIILMMKKRMEKKDLPHKEKSKTISIPPKSTERE